MRYRKSPTRHARGLGFRGQNLSKIKNNLDIDDYQNAYSGIQNHVLVALLKKPTALRIALTLLLAASANAAMAAPCISPQNEMNQRARGLLNCVQGAPTDAVMPGNALDGGGSATIARCQSDASTRSAGCGPASRLAPVKGKIARRVAVRTKTKARR